MKYVFVDFCWKWSWWTSYLAAALKLDWRYPPLLIESSSCWVIWLVNAMTLHFEFLSSLPLEAQIILSILHFLVQIFGCLSASEFRKKKIKKIKKLKTKFQRITDAQKNVEMNEAWAQKLTVITPNCIFVCSMCCAPVACRQWIWLHCRKLSVKLKLLLPVVVSLFSLVSFFACFYPLKKFHITSLVL